MSPSKGRGTVTANLILRGQNERMLQDFLGRILKFAGCAACGRLARVHFEFLGDPPVEIVGEGVASFESVGIGG